MEAHGTSWKQDQEMLLAEILLRNIRQGYSIGRGYDEAEKRIGRTRPAIISHWNNNLAGAYYNALQTAQIQGRKAREEHHIGKKIDAQHIDWIKKKYPEIDTTSIMKRIAAAEVEDSAYVEGDKQIQIPNFDWISSEPQSKDPINTIDAHESIEVNGFDGAIKYLETMRKYTRNLEEENKLLNMYYDENTKELESLRIENKKLKDHYDSVKELLDIAKKLQGVSYV